ncbi:MAG: LLM class F420-dependent oxidoreductase [Gammaproteobacteria bacterium]|nr:LLM class F420-dependent oxidoreductase [Gammaproteobacteria bacterium]|tara:strand:- start:1110 stop:1958 length:849 start_codon:yes stop_codon:yes gene_type:complete
MNIGLSNFPTDYSMSATALGRAAEERGFESLFVVEHTHIPASRRTPYALGGDLPSIYWESYEPFTYLAQVAAVTENLQIGTGICLVPEHHPIALAKRVASLDSLSGGRFLFGVGAGWNAEELENHGVEFSDRWKVLREHVLAMKQCWTEKDAEYHGEFVDFDPVWVEPKPVRKPHPPILIGASSKWAIERIVEYADGWLPILAPDFDERLAQLNQLCEEQGRNLAEIEITVFGNAENPEVLAELAEKGVNRLVLGLPTVGEDQALKVMDGYTQTLEWAQQLG